MDIEKEILTIVERNKRVEADKVWELSWARRMFIFVLTYVIAAVWLRLINEPFLLAKALVPAGGYLLSTLTLPALKRWWMQKNL